jgi:urea transport system ATP-binding protein
MLQVNELNQYYGGSHILRGVSFEAIAGEVTCLLGRNGVGKTTLLKCLMGLIPAKTGEVIWQGKKSPTVNRTSGCSRAWRMSRRGARFSRV